MRAQPAGAAAGIGERLSDELTHSVWAYVLRHMVARAAPSRAAPRICTLRPETAQGTPELVLVLERWRDGPGDWFRVRLPVSPNGTTGWVEPRDVGPLGEVDTALVVDRGSMRATLLRGGDPCREVPVGVGTTQWPTPAGRFYIRQRLVPARPTTLYGSFLFGTSAQVSIPPWPGASLVAIHGTNRPDRIPGAVSRGCIRLRNDAIEDLRALMPLGTPVRIH